jgi:hypothetical protein
MRLITRLGVQKFRSIREASLESLGHFGVLAGPNNAGKSNFLRALCAFFTGQIEPGIPLQVERDYYRPNWSAKKRKVIRVSLSFDLPASFRFRSELAKAETLLGGRQFTLAKEWTREADRPAIYLNDSLNPLSLEDQTQIDKFTSLISFRYIPNRVIPTDVISREHQAIRDVLVRRVGKLKKQSAEVFEGVQRAADALISGLAAETLRLSPSISALRLATANSLTDLVFKFGYRIQESDVEMDDSEQGSGVQSLLMFQTLHLIDRDFFQQFGWKQAAIWAVEEPESSLHLSLEVQVARFLSRVAREGDGRLQTLATSHSDVMVQYGDAWYFVSKANPSGGHEGSIATAKPMRELMRDAARFGVSRWVNPILMYPLDPLILVEGKTDRDFIRIGIAQLGLRHEYRIESLDDLTGDGDKGGVETLRKYVKENAEAILSRPQVAPIVIVLDWDARDKSDEFKKLVKDDHRFKVLAWDPRSSNPKLDETFRGVERFYSDRIIVASGQRANDLLAIKSNGQWCIPGKNAGALKPLLHETVLAGLSLEDLTFAREFLMEVHRAAGGAVVQAPPSPSVEREALPNLSPDHVRAAAERAWIKTPTGEVTGHALSTVLSAVVEYRVQLSKVSHGDPRIVDALVIASGMAAGELLDRDALQMEVDRMEEYIEGQYPDVLDNVSISRTDDPAHASKKLVFRTSLAGRDIETTVDYEFLASGQYAELCKIRMATAELGPRPYSVRIGARQMVAYSIVDVLEELLRQ